MRRGRSHTVWLALLHVIALFVCLALRPSETARPASHRFAYATLLYSEDFVNATGYCASLWFRS